MSENAYIKMTLANHQKIVSKIACKNGNVKVIDDFDVNKIYFCLNEKHIEIKKGYSNLPVVTNKCDTKYKKHRFELVDESKYLPFRRFICNGYEKKR